MREMVKTEKRRKAVLSIEHGRAVHGTGRANFLYLLARPCPCVARAVRADRTSVSAFLCSFTHFCFELAFGVNMKVLDNFVSFPMALV
jgi:hypothetical protein